MSNHVRFDYLPGWEDWCLGNFWLGCLLNLCLGLRIFTHLPIFDIANGSYGRWFIDISQPCL